MLEKVSIAKNCLLKVVLLRTEKRRDVEKASILSCSSFLLHQYGAPTLASLFLLFKNYFITRSPYVSYASHQTEAHVIFLEHILLFHTLVPFTNLECPLFSWPNYNHLSRFCNSIISSMTQSSKNPFLCSCDILLVYNNSLGVLEELIYMSSSSTIL